MIDRCERWLPWIAGLIALGVSLGLHLRGWDVAAAKQFDLAQFMGVAFNALAFATPVTVALFAITLAPGGGFIQKLFGTKTYSMFVGYVIVALVLGIASLIVTAPYLAAKSSSSAASELNRWTPVWWAVVSAATAAISRVLFIFLVWARSYSRPAAERRLTDRAVIGHEMK